MWCSEWVCPTCCSTPRFGRRALTVQVLWTAALVAPPTYQRRGGHHGRLYASARSLPLASRHALRPPKAGRPPSRVCHLRSCFVWIGHSAPLSPAITKTQRDPARASAPTEARSQQLLGVCGRDPIPHSPFTGGRERVEPAPVHTREATDHPRLPVVEDEGDRQLATGGGEDTQTGDRSGDRKVSSTTHPRQRSRNPTLSRLDVQAPPGR